MTAIRKAPRHPIKRHPRFVPTPAPHAIIIALPSPDGSRDVQVQAGGSAPVGSGNVPQPCRGGGDHQRIRWRVSHPHRVIRPSQPPETRHLMPLSLWRRSGWRRNGPVAAIPKGVFRAGSRFMTFACSGSRSRPGEIHEGQPPASQPGSLRNVGTLPVGCRPHPASFGPARGWRHPFPLSTKASARAALRHSIPPAPGMPRGVASGCASPPGTRFRRLNAAR